MCVIILREPNTDIPFEKIKSACIVNPDGWGFAIADRGKLEIIKGLDKVTDPEKIAKILEDAKHQSLMLHLRYVTVGKRSVENLHPFKVLDQSKDGIDLAFSHNGTLYSWKETGSDYSDSYHFAQGFVKPLLQRTVSYTGADYVLYDEWALAMLEKESGNGCFGLIDGNGIQANIDEGHQHVGWWSSNTYSFDRTHREPTPVKETSKRVSTYTGTEFDWPAADRTSEVNPPFHVSHLTASRDDIDVPEADYTEVLSEGAKIGEGIRSTNPKGKISNKLMKECLGRKVPSFVEITKISALSEVAKLDPDDIDELVSVYPNAAICLIRDLIAELYIKNAIKERASA